MRRSPWIAVLWLLPFTGACGGGGGGGAPATASLSGTVSFVPIQTLTAELSPTPALDSDRQSVGLDGFGRARITGELRGGRDLVRLRSAERLAVGVRLDPASSAVLAHLDPLSLELGSAGRSARFLARGPVDLLVRGADGPYRLELTAAPVTGAVPLEGSLGAFLGGDRLRATGPGRARLVCAESLDLAVTAEAPVVAYDGAGVELGRLGAQGGTLTVAGAPLQVIELWVPGPAPAEIELAAGAPAAVRPWSAPRPAGAERAVFGLDLTAPLATESSSEFVPGELLLRARDGADLAGALARRGARVTQRIPETSDLVALELPAGLDGSAFGGEAARFTLAAIAAFEVDPAVEWAEPNRVRRPQGAGLAQQALGGTQEPNDPFYSFQWHYDLIRLPQAWALTQGSADVVVAVIDTGERAHPDLDANTVAGFDFISSNTNSADGQNGIDDDPTDVGDGNGVTASSFHGTHVAGTIGAVSDNGLGVAGVNWVCSLMHLRVLGKNGGTDADIAQAVRYAAGLSNSSGTVPAQPAQVINMSLGGPNSTSTLQNAVTAARNAGVVIFAAAGNEATSTPSFPASYNGVISVAAVDPNAVKAPYSNFGPTLDLAAPGGDLGVDLDQNGFADGVLSTLVDEDDSFAPLFVFYQGTSMACPHAAGVAALMLALDPGLTPGEIESILESTAVDLGNPGFDNMFGNGLIQADLALAAVQGGGGDLPLLVVSSTSLQFGAETEQLTINLSNGGVDPLDVGTPSFAPTAPAGAFATLVTVPSTGSTDVSAIQVTVDRSGLADGTYQGVITIPSNGGTAQVAVSMVVATEAAPLDVDLYLLLLDAESFETQVEVVLNPTTGLDWEISDDGAGGPLPAGDYVLVCGSDDDNNFLLFEEPDLYGGAWPTLNQLQVITLTAGQTIDGLDFVVGPTQAASAQPSAASPGPTSGAAALRRVPAGGLLGQRK
jgi:serine protease